MAKGVLAITPDRELGRTLRVALTAAGAEAMTIVSPSEIPRGPIDASLVVLHQSEDIGEGVARIASRLRNGAQMIVILPRGDLAATVAALQSHEKVAGVLNADNIRTQEVTAMATRLLFGDIFGLDKVLPWGAHIHTIEVGDYEEKSDAIQRVAQFAASIGVRRKYRESIEQCCDEMLMNALYDAPVDARGRPLALGTGKKRAALKGDDRAIIEYGCDGQRFAVAVRDRFGRFERSVLVRYLDKCLHSADQIDSKVGGAGLGLYLMSHSASSLMFNVLPGVATECVCTFDIGATKLKLEQLAVFNERASGKPRREALRARGTMPAPEPVELAEPAAAAALAEPRAAESSGIGRELTVALTLAVLLLLGAVAVVGVPRFFGWESADASAGLNPPAAGAALADTAALPAAVAAAAPTGTLTVRTNVGGFITVQGVEACTARVLPLLRCPLPDGTHHVLVYGDDPRLSFSFTVTSDGTSIERHLAFGLVEARPGHGLSLSTAEPTFQRAAFPAGTQELFVADASGERNLLKIPVHVGQTVIVP